MADNIKIEVLSQEKEKIGLSEAEIKEQEDNRVKFLVWFTEALGRFKKLKPHHLNAVHAYFVKSLKIDEFNTQETFDGALIKFGFRRK